MKTRLMGGAVAFAIACAAMLVPSPAAVRAASTSCTGWASSLEPPPTVRVFRPSLKRTETVQFRAYVEIVLAGEWGASNPRAALEAGAVAVKQYAWYYALRGHWRGGRDAAGRCYDVSASTTDQLYDPARTPRAAHLAAVAATWSWTVRRGDALVFTSYRPGTGVCEAVVDGYRLYQRDASNCASKKRWTAEQILRRYYSRATSPAAVAVPGANDMTGDGRGDSTGLLADPATGVVTARLYTSDPGVGPLAAKRLAVRTLSALPGSLLARATTDATGDRRVDIVSLVARDGDTASLEVMPATGTGFGPPVTWWTGTVPRSDGTPFALDQLGLVAGDFNGDGKGDAGIVGWMASPAPYSALFIAPSTGYVFQAPIRRWHAGRDLASATLLAGDVTGDGRADLVAVRAADAPADATATLTEVAASQPSMYFLRLEPWATEPAPYATIKAVIGDATRDGRDDVIFARRIGDLTRILVDRSTGTSMVRTWFGPTQAIPWALGKFVVADLNRDARGDLVVFTDLGLDADGAALGTAIQRLSSTGTSFTLGDWLVDPSADWGALRPY